MIIFLIYIFVDYGRIGIGAYEPPPLLEPALVTVSPEVGEGGAVYSPTATGGKTKLTDE
jgi:hypothetical protein